MRNKLGDLSQVPDPTPANLALTARLFTLATNLYPKEIDRQQAMTPVLENLLGVSGDLESQSQVPGRNKKVAQGDFSIRVISKDGTTRYISEGEFKNELKDAEVQASVTYALRIAHEDVGVLSRSREL